MPSVGECARRVDTLDWARTSLGPRDAWSPVLRAMVGSILASKQPMLLFWGPELVQVYNDAFVPSFGRGKHPEAMGQRAAECWADAWPVVGAQIEAVMSRGEPAWFADAPVPIHRNGRMEEVFWTYSYSPAFEGDGRIVGTLVIVTEMTGRVVAARRLGALSELGAAVAAATSRDQVIDALRALAVANAADLPLVEIVDRPAGEVALAPPIAAGPWPEPVERMLVVELATGLRVGFGLSPRLPFDDGYRSYLHQLAAQLSAALVRISNADAARALVAERDSLLMHAPVATALLSGPSHVFQLANPLYRVLAGRDPTGQTFAAAFPERGPDDPIHGVLDRVYRTGEPYQAKAQRSAVGEGERYVDFHLQPLRDADGVVRGIMIVANDVTEQVRASRGKDEFLAMLGHELRNPLAPIASAIELMKRKDTGTTREQETIERQLKHVTRLVDDLMDVSRITRGTIDLYRQPLELGAVIGRAVEMARPLIEQREHRLSVELRAGLVVEGDELRLTQVMANLLTNAARYTPPGGEIGVIADLDGDRARVRVVDNGDGMDRELLDHVFDLFVQGKRGPDRAEGGLGIGLALVKNLVERHGGTVTADSDGRGAGSQLTVTLPLAPRGAVPATAARTSLPVTRTPKRVVIVDDNEDAAMLLGELLRTVGHEVATVHDPHAALDVIDRFEPHVAVLDIGLPGIDGYQLAALIHERRRACRLIALTGYGQRSDRDRALAAGFEAHFVKPVALADFLALLA